MIPVLGIPYFNRPDLLLRCLDSIDHPVGRVVLVMNGGPRDQVPTIIRAEAFHHPQVGAFDYLWHRNAGVAGAWNEIIKLFPADWWLLANNDIQFSPGDLGRLAEAVCKTDCACAYGNHGASWFGVTAPGIHAVGLFDENIFPAYLEDCDWSYRCDLLGKRRITVEGCSSVHGDGRQSGSCTVNATPELQKKNCRTHSGNFNYYRNKWGGINGQEQFKTPFNDPHWPVWAWRFEPGIRAAQQW